MTAADQTGRHPRHAVSIDIRSVEINVHGNSMLQTPARLQAVAEACAQQLQNFTKHPDGVTTAHVGDCSIESDDEHAKVKTLTRPDDRGNAGAAAAVAAALLQASAADREASIEMITVRVDAQCLSPPRQLTDRRPNRPKGNEVSVTTFPDGRMLPVWHVWQPAGRQRETPLNYQSSATLTASDGIPNTAVLAEVARSLCREMRLRTSSATDDDARSWQLPEPDGDNGNGAAAAAPRAPVPQS